MSLCGGARGVELQPEPPTTAKIARKARAHARIGISLWILLISNAWLSGRASATGIVTRRRAVRYSITDATYVFKHAAPMADIPPAEGMPSMERVPHVGHL